MAERKKLYRYYQKSVPMVFGDGWLVRIEKRAFGWQMNGSHSEEVSYTTEETEDVPVYDSSSGQQIEGVTAKRNYTKRHSKIVKYREFGRVTPYSYNVIFHAFEFLSGIFSLIRRVVMSLVDYVLLFVVGVLLLMGLLEGFNEAWSWAEELIIPFAGLYLGCVVAPSLLIAAIGYACGYSSELSIRLRNL